MTKKSYVIENGLTAGIVGLAAVVVVAVGLPHWAHAPKDTSPINLPQTLSGGLAKQSGANGLDTQTQALTSALGVGGSAASYVSADQQHFIFVQAVRTGGAALLPLIAGTASKVGDDVCINTQYATQSQALPIYTCRRTGSEMTVQVTATTDTATAAKYADEVWKDLN